MKLQRSTDGNMGWILYRDVVTIVPLGTPTIENQREAERAIASYAAAQGPVGVVVSIDTGVPAPPDEIRKELSAMYGRLAPHVRAVAQVAAGDGFRAAGVRAVLSGINLAARRPYPTHVAGDLRAALEWLLPKLEGGPARRGEADDFARVIQAAWSER